MIQRVFFILIVSSFIQLFTHNFLGSLRDAHHTTPQAASNGEREDEEPSSTSSGGILVSLS